ncbi:replication-associated recombination protein A [Paraconexibacter algicola]|uniref:replication-associated recombination protein A n=1 Tax=Paraconexibacter algicola TaxID=2133960 RepID=UPI001E3951C0|nr:replication-associated recombination protein A [Paraconexibacter algicola]
MDQLFAPEPTPEEPPPSRDAPLAARLRPRTIADVVGQDHLLAPGSALRTAIETGRPHSMLLYGPPGTGKTTLARIVARAASAAFEELSAVEAGRAEVRAVMARATERRRGGQPTVFFLDEIHRFNKGQQDALLPAVEDGLVTLIGATTENPSFEVNAALLSRTRLYELQALTADGVRVLLDRAVERGEVPLPADDGALAFLADRCGGDARTALGALELAAVTAASSGAPSVSLAHAEDALQRRAIRFDKAGDQHYDTISAWIKATRASDPDASLYYLAVMLEAGEDPRFIARRMVILASEDIGLADPTALPVAVAAMQAAHLVGMPEAHYPLAQAAVHLALSPKSHAVGAALHAARAHVREHGAAPPPAYLRSASRREPGYDYPHDRPGHLTPQDVRPEAIRGLRFYEPDDMEPRHRQRVEDLRRARGLP